MLGNRVRIDFEVDFLGVGILRAAARHKKRAQTGNPTVSYEVNSSSRLSPTPPPHSPFSLPSVRATSALVIVVSIQTDSVAIHKGTAFPLYVSSSSRPTPTVYTYVQTNVKNTNKKICSSPVLSTGGKYLRTR